MPEPSKTIAIFGADGRTGRVLAAAAIERGWRVRAAVRATKRPAPAAEGRIVLRASLDDPEELAAAIRSCDAVCCVYGPRPRHLDVFCAQATRRIVDAMKQCGVRRLICQTGATVGERLPNRTFCFELMARAFERRQPEAAEDRRLQETIVQASNLDWTIFKPPRLTNGPRSGKVRLGPDLRVGMLSRISRADLADCILGEIESPRFIRQAVFVRGSRLRAGVMVAGVGFEPTAFGL